MGHHERVTLLTDPFLQRPAHDSLEVAWFTEFVGDSHHVLLGERAGEMTDAEVAAVVSCGTARGVRVVAAETVRLSRVAEDPDSHLPADRKPNVGISAREVYRHHAAISVPAGVRTPYRVVSVNADALAVSGAFTVRGPLQHGEPAVVMLTSDHQLLGNTPANIEFAARTIAEQLGDIDAVFMPGDLVNDPDRASEWFDDQRGTAFFPVMQGCGAGVASDGKTYRGAPILQHAPLYPAVGNHEVHGRRAGHTSLGQSFTNAVPRDVAEAEYARVAGSVNPAGDDEVKAQWIEDNSFSLTTYEEIFSTPRSGPGGKRYYATTVGDIRLITLFATRVWRADGAGADSAARTATTRFQESRDDLEDPLRRGHGSFIFEDLAVGSPQHEWLRRELDCAEFRNARYTVVMLHEGPHTVGENVVPAFTPPHRVEERDERGELIGVRYDYPAAGNILLRDVVPLLERAGVDLVYSGHNHLWNRFVSPAGVHYLEASNTGNSFGAFLDISGRSRPAPPAPWNGEDTAAQGDPGGLHPVVPTIEPLRDDAGRPLPYIADDNIVVFQALHTGTGCVTSWYVDLTATSPEPVTFDEFHLH
ncbi:metallophosphoesterase family protein [Mycolicibacterium baixiangningiae]|uniref:metallophosphoesterase family protein n=1 Tax=Mycolicibacterium baixiangningiae TaxID=2761578 RepID=UPI0018D19DC4|nr:metallophosphoesterase [Mycolicibacterium baixiangningiae]